MRLHPLFVSLIALIAFATAASGASAQLSRSEADSLHEWLRAAGKPPGRINIVGLESLRAGPRAVGAGERVAGSVVAFRGNLDVRGAIDGDAIALVGDVILHPGATVGGDAIAVAGRVRQAEGTGAAGGTVAGEIVTLSRVAPALAGSGVRRTGHAVSLATGWLVMLAAVGVAVLFLARRNLERLADTIETRFARAFLWGLAGQLALLPVLLLGIVALAITIVGILLIPFAIVAYFVAAAGALALGFLAMAYVAGEAVGRRLAGGALQRSAVALLLVGLLLFYVVWLVPALMTWAGILGSVLRLFATVITWVAATVGFGAALMTRGGTREIARPAEPLAVADDYTWQTPTPVTGVAAARRPTPYPRPQDHE